MTDAAIIRATFETYKHVPTRKALQIILEVPAEGQEAVFKALGYPNANQSIWVAVARLVDGVVEPEPIEEQQPEPEAPQIDGPASDDAPYKPIRPLSQISAYLCTIVAFRRFLWEEFNLDSMPTADQAADFVRSHCGVQSRREFDLIESAAANFRHLRWKYNAWLQVPA